MRVCHGWNVVIYVPNVRAYEYEFMEVRNNHRRVNIGAKFKIRRRRDFASHH